MKDNAGTDVRHHNGQLLATMSQGGEPWRLDPITLETLGPDTNMSRRIKEGVSSHYKVDIDT
ncbi:carotenoid oxygenase family protein, partial [Stenotrophomonas maltophilia]|uniref:carotenoid oxygenase family protein n=1 Tax=Stenotrophomonas maltophilia TaxID=40324 RepID=UPI00195485D3